MLQEGLTGEDVPERTLGPKEADAIHQAQLEIDGSDGVIVVL